MKKKQYATTWKYVGIIVQLVFTVFFVMSLFLLGALLDKNMIDNNDITNQNFTDSGYYNSLFEQQTEDLVEFLKIREKFESDGEYQADKPINIIKYASNISILEPKTEERVVAKEDGVITIEPVTRSSTDETDMDDNETESVISTEKDDENLVDYKLSELVAWSKDGYHEENGTLVETYLPIAGKGIAETLADGEITASQAQQIYTALKITLDSIGEEETTYKKALNAFEEEETNLKYCYCEDGALIYTNMEKDGVLTDAESILEYAREQGSFLYYNGGDLKFKTNVEGMEDYFYSILDGELSGLGSSATLMIAVDTTFPYQDAFTEAKTEYNKLHPWVMISIVLMVVSFFAAVISLVYLTLAAGHRPKNDRIYLNWLDKIKTELYFGIFVVITVLMIAMAFAVSDGDWNIPGILVLVGVIAFLYDIIFMLFYLSMVRRLKAGVMWEYSMISWLLQSGRRAMNTWKASMRVLVIYGIDVCLILFATEVFFYQRKLVGAIGLFALIFINGAFYLREVVQNREIMKGIDTITSGELTYKIPLENLHGDNKEMAEAINSIGDGLSHAVNKNTKNERMKADLITNVSHDIKTPLTSIINYVNLIKIEDIQNERIKGYVEILDDKSQRLKQLTEDLVEASRISSGNIKLQMVRINMVELIYQTAGEFNEKFEIQDLTIITKLPKESVTIMADGRRIWRVVENLYSNVAKYAMAHTRVYVTMEKGEKDVLFSIKNISEQPLVVDGADLTERFTRGDEARTTEGSGLGLSIAENLTTLMGGKFNIELDGDLFTASITFPLVD